MREKESEGLGAAILKYIFLQVMKPDIKNDVNFSMKSRLMDMRKAVNHPYLIEYPILEDGFHYK